MKRRPIANQALAILFALAPWGLGCGRELEAPDVEGGDIPAPATKGAVERVEPCPSIIEYASGTWRCGGAKGTSVCANQSDCQAHCPICAGDGGLGGQTAPPPQTSPNPPPVPTATTTASTGNCTISVSNVNGVRTCGGAKAGVVCTSDADCQAKCLVCS